MKIIYTLHSTNHEKTFPTLENLRRFVLNPKSNHLLNGATADRRAIHKNQISNPDIISLDFTQ